MTPILRELRSSHYRLTSSHVRLTCTGPRGQDRRVCAGPGPWIESSSVRSVGRTPHVWGGSCPRRRTSVVSGPLLEPPRTFSVVVRDSGGSWRRRGGVPLGHSDPTTYGHLPQVLLPAPEPHHLAPDDPVGAARVDPVGERPRVERKGYLHQERPEGGRRQNRPCPGRRLRVQVADEERPTPPAPREPVPVLPEVQKPEPPL